NYYQVGAVLEQFRPGLPAPHEIRAHRDVTIVDLDETARLKAKRAGEVPPVYEYDRTALEEAKSDLTLLYDALFIATEEHDALLRDKHFSAATIARARHLPPRAQAGLRAVTHHVLEAVMAAESRLEYEAMEQRAVNLLRARLPEPDVVTLAVQVVRGVLRPTWMVNETLTEKAREAARATVEPVTQSYRRGQVVVRKDAILTGTLLQQLKQTGLLTPAPITRVAPIAALMLLGVLALGLYLRNHCPAVYARHRTLLLLAMLIIASVGAQMLFGANQSLETPVSLIALPAGAMAIAGLLGVQAAIVSTLFMVVIAGLTAHHQYAVVLLAAGASLAGIMAIGAIWPASRLVPAVITLIVTDFLLLIIATGLLPGVAAATLLVHLGPLALTAAAGGLGATIVAAGAIYILARPFSITTAYRLMELANPNEPLLRRMMAEAPGSYHSSVMVANLAEAAADAIGGDMLLARAAALYHDIGKLKRPAFFVENQAPLGVENVHLRLSPKLSYLILISHVRDGEELGKKAHLPEEILTIIREHHGTSLAAYFYHRALSEAGDQPVSEFEFRYPGPRPSTRESAVVMLSDSVQASVKALKEPTPTRIAHMVRDIIESRLADGQLDDCGLTLRDLRVIGEVFTSILSGLYTYTRIEYPVLNAEGARERGYSHTESTPAPGGADAAAPRR
ncbi:MAG TPA: HDIG domain-containing protein, partial [Armatimonadota bacterium]|nr:HDIG domain-containing protein [Armatimonadota bacterium]